MKIGIVGLGLIGGSVAKAIKNNTEHTVLGGDINIATVYKARLLEAIDGELTDEVLGECDMVIVALYPGSAAEFIEKNAAKFKKGAIVLDCAGVKRAVCERAWKTADENGFAFIGGHPMAGVEFSGFEHSRKGLFQNASMILTPAPKTGIEVLEKIKELCISIGFTNVVISSPEEHDKMIAYTSQLAHVVSSAYVKSEQALGHRGFSAGSYRDMTRVAKLNEDMWTELFMLNRENLVTELEGLILRLEEYKDAIEEGHEEEIKRLLREGRERKAAADAR